MSESPVHKVVVAAMIERGGKLLAHRRPEGSWGAGMWELPGGKLETGEDPRRATERECKEELGIDVEPNDVFDVVCHEYEDLGSVVLLFIKARITEGEPEALTGGELRWIHVDDADELNWLPADIPVIEKWARHEFPRI